jgi:rhodanese-related sulfurtransferase/DNA-directed RNA polymerase subunit RPC12/RpoP
MKSHFIFNKVIIIFSLTLFVWTDVIGQSNKQANIFYQCIPCGSACDTLSFKQPGNCPHCHMELVKKSAINLGSIEPSRICKYINEHPTVLLLDVRTKEEFEGKADPDYGTLKNAVNIPIQQLESRISEISKYKNREIIVYCSHSQRSPRAGYLLLQNGFTKVTNMTGGLSVMKDKACKK